MAPNFVHYDLLEGFVSNWLVGGPQTIPLDRTRDPDFETLAFRENYQAESGIAAMPVERGPITEGTFSVDEYEGVWAYYVCREDHFVDLSEDFARPQYGRAWVYAQILSDQTQEVQLKLSTYGPADIWLNGQHLCRQEGTGGTRRTLPVEAALQEGGNEILLRFETVGLPDRRLAIALQVCQAGHPELPAAGVRVRLPTTIQQLKRREKLERTLNAAYLVQDVFERSDVIAVHWPDDFEGKIEVMVRLQSLSGRIYGEAYLDAKAGERILLSQGYQVPAGRYQILIMPRPEEYYEDQLRIKRELPIWVLGRSAHSSTYYDDYAARVREALNSAALHKGQVFAEIAKMKLGNWDEVDSGVLEKCIDGVTTPGANGLLDLIGLAGMLYRFGEDPNFPENLIGKLEACLIEFQYTGYARYLSENRKFLLHTAEILAGQLYPERTFKAPNQDGQWLRNRGEKFIIGWLHTLGCFGFPEWDSPDYFANLLIALSHLIDLSEAEQVWEMAAVVLDKVLLTMALNSYQGVFGASQGQAASSPANSGLLAPTAGITRLTWGTGIYNHHIAGTVSMACLENYEIPDILPEIALAQPEEVWNREQHVWDGEKQVNKVCYRRPEYMLCSAQDHHPGEEGAREHLWQATLGPAAFVFANHPTNASTGGICAPDFWTGNALLPRVAQWKEVLIAIHKLPQDDWLGFTHAYFPAYAFDETVFHNSEGNQDWAFARVGEGYLALTASPGMHPIQHGHSANRELRAFGKNQIWICHLGSKNQDGSFIAFQKKILALELSFHKASVQMETLRGEILSFGWEGPFQRDGVVQPLAGFKHYENPYCTAEFPCLQLEARTKHYLLRLNFESLPETEVQI